MFERFTNRARRVVVLSQEEARRLHHNYIGTEHILLGLLRLGEPEDIGYRVLEGSGMTLDGVRQEVLAMIGEGQQDPAGRIPFTPRAKKVLELSLREALQLHHNYIGTEHILLGLIREGDGVAGQIMRKHADLLAIRAAVLDAVPPGTTGESARRGWLRRRVPSRPFELPLEPGEPGEQTALNATPAADTTLTEASRLAGAQPVGSHHLLLAALADEASAAARALVSLGVDLDQAKNALRQVDVTGTSDEQPEEAGRRQMNIQVGGEMVTVVATDPLIVEAGRDALLALAAQAASGESAEKSGKREKGQGSETGAPGGVIRGADLKGTAAASLATAWQALHDSLDAIRSAATAPESAAGAESAGAESADKPGKPDKPDKPETPENPGTPDAGAA